MWIKCKGRENFIEIKALGLIHENERGFSVIGSILGGENQGILLGKFRDEDVAKNCIKGFEEALIQGKNFFDINNFKTK